MTDSRIAASSYTALELPVVPITPGKKHPGIPEWQNRDETGHDRLKWWDENPALGVGIVTGRAAGLFVLDVDTGDNKNGAETLDELQTDHGDLPETWTVETGSGGRHYYYRLPEGVEIRNDAGTRLGPGLDIRGEGGQVVAPPTRHPNGTPYRWAPGHAPHDIPLADPPEWLLSLLTAPPATTPPENANPPSERPETAFPAILRAPESDLPRPGDIYTQNHTWAEILTADGWTPGPIGPEGEQRWTRPGKNLREGCSATTNYKGSDLLKVFTSSVPHLEPDATYSRFSYYAHRHHRGDHSAAAAQLRAEQAPPAHPTPPEPELDPETGEIAPIPPDERRFQEIDWPAFWAQDPPETQWAVDRFIPAGRQTALYATHKTGKSLITLDIAAQLALGGRPFGHPGPERPWHVVYLDLEMTQQDVWDRLENMGHREADFGGFLHYHLLPDLAPLDTAQGLADLAEICTRYGYTADAVIIDTVSRVTEGEENSADTIQNFYRFTGKWLKKRNITVCRLDHAGKKQGSGQRGSSAKGDDVDAVWRITASKSGEILAECTASRIAELHGEKLTITRAEEPLRHTIPDGPVPAGMAEWLKQLKRAGVTADTTQRELVDKLKAAGEDLSRRKALRALDRVKQNGYPPENEKL